MTSYRLTSSLEQTPGALAQVNWTWQFSGSPNPMPPPSSSSSSSPLDVKSARGSCWLLMLHTAWTKHTHTKQHKEELCIKCRSNIWQVTVVSVSGFLGAAVMCAVSKVWDLPRVQFLSPTNDKRYLRMSCYSNDQISISCTKKSSFMESMGFPKVLHEWLLPW